MTDLTNDTLLKLFQPRPPQGLRGDYQVPGDKSISQRALIFGALAQGTSTFTQLLQAADVRATAAALRQLGSTITTNGSLTTVHGLGSWRWRPQTPAPVLNLGNSGTGARLLLGLLVRQNFATTLRGDASLSARPLTNFLNLLGKMGADFAATDDFLPLTVKANQHLTGGDYQLPVASAQLKSALILAALQADGPTRLQTIASTRDHTERLLALFGNPVHSAAGLITVKPAQRPLQATNLQIPGDPSSAAFLIVAALLLPASHLVLHNHSLNPTRSGLLQLLRQNGAPLHWTRSATQTAEPVGTVTVGSWKQISTARPLLIDQSNLGTVIDEIPILSLLATQLNGTSVIRQAASLRHKETDRLAVIAEQLGQLGAAVTVQPAGLQITGPTILHLPRGGRSLDAHSDHRIAMMLIVAELLIGQAAPIAGLASIATSYPSFLSDLGQLTQGGAGR